MRRNRGRSREIHTARADYPVDGRLDARVGVLSHIGLGGRTARSSVSTNQPTILPIHKERWHFRCKGGCGPNICIPNLPSLLPFFPTRNIVKLHAYLAAQAGQSARARGQIGLIRDDAAFVD